MRRIFGMLLGLFAALPLVAGAQPVEGERVEIFESYAAFNDSLEAVVASGEAAVDAFWNDLKAANQVPFAVGDSVAFLYRGAANSVAWNGDFNGWGGDQSVENQGRKLEGTDLWILEMRFPADARIDYKIVRNGNDWILDPNNPLQQWSGFGPNSELRMPAYVYPQETIPRDDVAKGTLSENIVIASPTLGYDVQYRVYTPAGYDSLDTLPTLYVTDGQEYADPRLGSLPIVLDNLIADGRIEPILAVFVDPREPGNLGNNRRRSQYADAYESFAMFLADALVPAIDAAYRTDASPEARGILGTSLGGLFSAYLGAARPDVFRRIGIHSPAFWYDTRERQDTVYRMYTTMERLPLQIFMSTGTINDTEGGSRRMKAAFDEKGYPLLYEEVNEGHSWGNWRALLDEPLEAFWGTGTRLGRDDRLAPREGFDLTSYPNPFREAATIAFRLPRPQRVALDVFDLRGRRVQTLVEAALPAGPHAVTWAASGWPSGIYFYRLAGPTTNATGQMLLIR